MTEVTQCDSPGMMRGWFDRVERQLLALVAEYASLHPPST